QFGFKVSETWGYQFLRERLGVLIGIQIILFWLSTSIVVIKPSEVGKQVDVLGGDAALKTLEPGFHLKMPWPFASVERFYPKQVHSFIVGLQPSEDFEITGRSKLWANPIGMDYDALRKSGALYFMAGGSKASDGQQSPNILVASVPVHYKIKEDEELVKGWLRFANPEKLLENIAYREISSFFLGSNLEKLLKTQGSDANKQVKKAIQDRANTRGLGVTILFVGLGDIRPPAESPADIKGKSSSDLSTTNMAQAVELRFASMVEAKVETSTAKEFEEAEILRRDAGVEQENVRAKVEVDLAEDRAKAKMERLRSESGPYRAAPEVYRQWRYLEAFRKAVANARKFVIAVGKGIDVQVDLDLQESLRRDLYEVKGGQ
ncbi:uncharacterized protein METZ01_LOCUS266328, partial [marine metagenome]